MAVAVEMKGIVKRFGSVVANDGVDFSAAGGEIHALLGENGAGKSTIMCMLSGVYRADAGVISLNGKPTVIRSPKDALSHGIGMVHQHFRLVPALTALENIVLGEKGSFWRGAGWKKAKTAQIEKMAQEFGLPFHLDRPVWQLSVGEQQRVEIVKTLYRGADIIILDEPTSVLTPQEADELFQTLARLKAKGKTIILTTHKLKEVMASADRISIMRKGKMITTINKTDTDEKQLARLMVGRDIERSYPENAPYGQEAILEVQGLRALGDHGNEVLKGVDLIVRRGEIAGIAGVAGNGQKELAEVLTGLRPSTGGAISIQGDRVQGASVRTFIDKGIGHIPENRMKTGLAGSLGAADNLLMKSYRSSERSGMGLMKRAENRSWAEELVRDFDVKTAGIDTPVVQLSGGNQQKVIFAREIRKDPALLVAVHPTQGLDVGATEGVHTLLRGLKQKGSGVLLISEDLDEVMQLADTLYVIFGGELIGTFKRSEFDLERIGLMMAGMRETEGAAV